MLKQKIEVGYLDMFVTRMESELQDIEKEMQKQKRELVSNEVRVKLLKEDIAKVKSVAEKTENCKLCKLRLACEQDDVKHCIILEEIYCDYRICNQDWDMEWRSQDKNKSNLGLVEFDSSHLHNIINFLYKNNKATIEKMAPESMKETLRNEQMKIRERTLIRIIRQILANRELNQFDTYANDVIQSMMKEGD